MSGLILLLALTAPAAAQVPAVSTRTIVVTGFIAYSRYSFNASEEIVKKVRDKAAGSYRVVGATLPVCLEGAGQVAARIVAQERPAALVMFGQSWISAPTFEVVAGESWSGGCEPCVAKTTCPAAATPFPGAAGRLRSPPPPGLIERLKIRGLVFGVSENPGSFVCNATYYAALRAARDSASPTKIMFIHVPIALAAGPELEKTKAWGEAFVAEVAAYLGN